ncbi:3-oxoacyl-[acyl-carrier-protein] synthase III C-terminal domain-containing protein [Xanthobacter autotrophicus DSM 431]|uniref:3-oxoacyl-[acyl-carrier-protein] synthase III C-terminal domain-containing protein n=1 Tax=Xanthobacter nonsaccharivorans TaxID=3119912 RepID=UPI0037265D41
MTGITAIGIHLPRLRLARASMAAAMDWLSPRSDVRGARTLAFWDEDSITMSVAAARACLAHSPEAREAIRGLVVATTTPVFAEPQNASLVHAALRLPARALAQDTSGTQRCGLIALHAALEGAGPALVVAADSPVSPAGSLAEMRYGDGAAAVLVGGGPELLAYRGGASLTAPFIERYRSADRSLATDWEERWVREEGFLAFVPRAIADALAAAGLAAGDIHHFVLPSVIPGCAKAVAQATGLGHARLATNLDADCGDTGSAHALVMLARAMQDMKPGERVVVAQFGQGATALVLEATDALAGFETGASASIAAGIIETHYLKLPVFRGLLAWERGLRGRLPVNEALTTAYRNSEALLGFVGGRSPETGHVQFPASRLAVAEKGFHAQPQEPWPLADLGGTVATATADRLAFSRSPPNCYGLVDIPGGARLMMDFTDPDAARLAPGDAVRFVFRIKDMDERTGYRRYFWKAVAASALPAAA